MTLASLIFANLWAKKARSSGIILAVALAVMTVVTLVAVSSGLEGSAAELITIGRSDFTVAQKGVSQSSTAASTTASCTPSRPPRVWPPRSGC